MVLAEVIKSLSVLNTVIEWVALIAIFRLPNRRSFFAMTVYLGIDAVLGIPLNLLLYTHWLAAPLQYQAYLWLYWADYYLQAAAVFFVVQHIFSEALSPLPGLRRLGLVIFRWITVTSVVIAVASASYPLSFTGQGFENIMMQVLRCVNLMQVCVLVFLALSVHSLGLSFRSRTFGIGLGFGISASADLIVSAIFQQGGTMYSYTNLFGVCTSSIAITIWMIYFMKSEPMRQPVTLPVTSPLLRWNEIANALGHKGGQVVVGQPAFFLQDVESVVDRVLSKNALNEPRAS